MYSCLKDYNSFSRNLGNLQQVQEAILLHYISSNAQTAFGRNHSFENIKSYSDFNKNVPIIENWDQIKDYISQIEQGKTQILTSDEVFAFEETSGSTGFSKLIPYNKSLKNELLMVLSKNVEITGNRNSLFITTALFPLAAFCIKPRIFTANVWKA